MAIDLLNNPPVPPHDRILAAILLAQVGIKPAGCDCQEQCGCQYEINAFDIDVERIRIVDHAQEIILRVMEVKG